MNEKNPAETSQSASGAKAPGDSTAITSYGAFQAYLTKILTNNISQNTGKSEEQYPIKLITGPEGQRFGSLISGGENDAAFVIREKR